MNKQSPDNRDIFKLAWPIAMNAILLQLILVIDTVLVTPLGEVALAAMGLAASIAGIILGSIMAFSNGTQLLIAQAYGAESDSAMRNGFGSGQVINWIITVVGIAFILLFSPALIALVAETQAMAEMTYSYLVIFSLAILSVSVCQNITVFFNATGNSKLPFYANLFEAPVNVAISYILIYGAFGIPAMGLPGAAAGSAIAVFSRLIFLLWFMHRQQPDYLRHQTISHLSTGIVKHHFKTSAPIAGTFVSMMTANSVCTLIYAKLGIYQFAALTLILPWTRVAAHLVTSWAHATGILVGQLLGKQQWDAVDGFVSRAWRASFYLAFIVALLYLGMFFLFEAIYPELEQETKDTLWQFMPILLIIPFVRSSNTICGHVLRAGGDATHVMKIHAYTQWLLIVPLSALFVLYLELSAVWVFGLILFEELVKFAPFHIRMLKGGWKKRILNG